MAESTNLIIGPAGSGKTTLLASLYHACANMKPNTTKIHAQFYPQSEPARRIISIANTIVEERRLPLAASDTVEQFTFDLKIKRNRIFYRTHSMTFRMWDGPGGTLFPQVGQFTDMVAHQQFRTQLVGALRGANGLMLCIDSTDPDAHKSLFRSLPDFLFETGQRELPVTKAYICLTKVDRYFYRQATKARAAAEAPNSARARLDELMPTAVKSALSNFLKPNVKIAISWCSPYGFMPEGEPNYDEDTDELRRASGVADINAWHPYRVLEPFMFLMGFRIPNLTVIRARDFV
ncbi:hypothetical protein G6O69_18440 [Pseudenhygromyxa sp. WMMC2535]|uniref:hypothetical protein n=1 Tax=Pseudenhygromyxa sp. WMMC2535 TaxID=2712867 RepID=UPI001551AB13|nr:hypothetical protein [Pseudenhygromyxa sp. WMMC2535]NVB39828.1 hypothetical protein [Pseudenhygromyxa sp. WMMC2535]